MVTVEALLYETNVYVYHVYMYLLYMYMYILYMLYMITSGGDVVFVLSTSKRVRFMFDCRFNRPE